jgi:hypothetical protein
MHVRQFATLRAPATFLYPHLASRVSTPSKPVPSSCLAHLHSLLNPIRSCLSITHIVSVGSIDFSKFGAGGPNPALVPIASPGFAAARDKGELDANMQRAPVILVDGKTELGQSKTIERYLARRLGLMGSGEEEGAQIDAITEHVRDIKDKYQKAKADKDEKAKYFAEVMPDFMQKMDTAIGVVGGKGTGPLIGKSLSLADVTLFVFIYDFFDDKDKAKAAVAKCPRLLASLKATSEDPGIVKYRTKRDKKK